ncbi:site-2 protease family protein [Bradyrhizobium sp. AZCC 2289]|uniref:site-2 protease family protein n=1 Tax=Bradyrhizobium sp. AZCC 2289 TaxID=3117026 RepID=UPI002FF0A409
MDPNTYIVIIATLYGLISLFAGIAVHELGHFLAARFLGIEVSGVSVGFGPEIVGFTDRYGVRWKLAPLPVGGACSFRERPRGKGDRENKLRTLREASLADRAIVLVCGPASNLCFAGLIWLIIFFHTSILPFMPEEEAVFGLPAFLLQLSCAIAFFNLLPIPPLDGGYLVLIAFEKLRGRAVSNEKQLIRAGAWVIAVLTIVTSVLLFAEIASL